MGGPEGGSDGLSFLELQIAERIFNWLADQFWRIIGEKGHRNRTVRFEASLLHNPHSLVLSLQLENHNKVSSRVERGSMDSGIRVT